MFLGLRLEIAVVTNVEWDHVDCYPTPAPSPPHSGSSWHNCRRGACWSSAPTMLERARCATLLRRGTEIRTYGLSPEADWQARNLHPNARGGTDAEVWLDGPEGEAKRPTWVRARPPQRPQRPGCAGGGALARHQAAVGRGHAARFQGRRPPLRGHRRRGRRDRDRRLRPPPHRGRRDPLSAARLRYPTRRIWAVFQPHTYSRTQALLADYAHSFEDVDQVIFLDIYAAREKIDLGMHSRLLLEAVHHPGAQYIGGIEDAAAYLLAQVAPDDIVITLSAGDGNRVGQLVLGCAIAGARGRGAQSNVGAAGRAQRLRRRLTTSISGFV